MEKDSKVKEKREEFLKERLEEAHYNLELENDNSIKMFYEDEIKNLERWLKESEGLDEIKRDKEFTEWKIDFLKNWIKFLKDMDNSVDYVTLFSELSIREFWTNYNPITRILYIIKYDRESSESEINSIKDDEFFIRMYIEELKNDSIK